MDQKEIELPEIQEKINWINWYDQLTGFNEWINKWKEYHNNKHEN